MQSTRSRRPTRIVEGSGSQEEVAKDVAQGAPPQDVNDAWVGRESEMSEESQSEQHTYVDGWEPCMHVEG